MGANAPQWLFGSFVDAMTGIGATAPVPVLEAEARNLVARWNEPGRHLHNTQHLINVLARIDELSTIAHDADVLRVSFWYHGAFLNRALEVRILGVDPTDLCHPCIVHTTARLTELGVSQDVVERIGELLQALVSHHADRGDLDAQVIIDADLSLLASSPQVFKRYRESLRAEFDDLDDLTYWRARRLAVRRLLAMDSIFHSPIGRSWEAPARANLEVELARLEQRVREADPDALSRDDEADGPIPTHCPEIEADMSSAGALIIKKRLLRKNACPTSSAELSSTGVLPAIRPMPVQDKGAEQGDEDGASSLETAIDAMDLPSMSTDVS
ncbi:hypothetical protein I6B53_01930 [Schaalia sp. 19OD2882]|uniref:HD domain-containing protein n=1 Tax=Schaalia sp. 19OD2882 TaxID=2794089 RepID=UPI001C1EDED2|nr:hypothetical protein [Schaalia sp. 19OD2882]QWW19905.1 hypothetical protein I6B53_01930 [Schaalia sp. 19OD2882]